MSSRPVKGELTVRLRRAHGHVIVGSRSRYGQVTVSSLSSQVSSLSVHVQVKVWSWSHYGQVTVRLRLGHGQVKAGSRSR